MLIIKSGMKKRNVNSRWLLGVISVAFLSLVASFMASPSFDEWAHGQDPINPERLKDVVTAENGEFHGKKVVPPALAAFPIKAGVLSSTSGKKRIEVDLTNQRLYAYEGDQMIYNFLVSTGKWGRTPTGTFTIWGKFKATKMSGGSRALRTYYYLPNVPYVMFFSNKEI